MQWSAVPYIYRIAVIPYSDEGGTNNKFPKILLFEKCPVIYITFFDAFLQLGHFPNILGANLWLSTHISFGTRTYSARITVALK